MWAQGSPRDLVAFVRYENFDTQFRMPDGYVPLKEFDRDAWVVGVTYYPDPDVAREGRLRPAAQPERHRPGAPTASTSASAGGSDDWRR